MACSILVEYRKADIENLLDFERLAELVLKEHGPSEPAEASVSFIDTEEIHRLNRDYRSMDKPTDVLSFECDGIDDDFSAPAGTEDEPFDLGDIFIAVDIAEEQAQLYGLTFAEEVSLLMVHGLLHLCGYDHMDPEEAMQMEAMEEAILSRYWEHPFDRQGHEEIAG